MSGKFGSMTKLCYISTELQQITKDQWIHLSNVAQNQPAIPAFRLSCLNFAIVVLSEVHDHDDMHLHEFQDWRADQYDTHCPPIPLFEVI
ncbi:hypothetical protein L3Y34_000798 [Caenorhabditis briggsae]|nr:hypothetical protein L3Y34_000798 [Caenorhabditis briggsae]